MNGKRRVRLITAGLAVALGGCIAAPAAGAGVLPSKYAEFKSVTVGKYRVGPSVFSDQTSAGYRKGPNSVSYQGTGTGDVEHVEGDFGDYGKIDMTFHKSGPFKRQKLPKGCSGKPVKKQKGIWKGKFKVDGEGRLPSVHKNELQGALIKPGDYDCAGNFPTYVNLSSFGWTPMQFGASVRKSGGKPGFYANTSETKKNAVVSRNSFYRGKASTFTYDDDYTMAKVKPRGPFSGSATYQADPPRGGTSTSGTLTSNLKVTFLGKSGKQPVPTGPAFLGDGAIFRPSR